MYTNPENGLICFVILTLPGVPSVGLHCVRDVSDTFSRPLSVVLIGVSATKRRGAKMSADSVAARTNVSVI